ncbi:adenine deaminase [Candidatus Arthromitus sp. SFB-rat-Yit]|uniref:adenine deaminase n=1 Tax=Candidatus Arthromitus sp. SFB-rat-Yit TaxID=1041504 RepID=UPI000227A5EA|nr:adenine deaminase [Candidatus Arthromitus sp. SFB-rat-Yit]BAK81639.1 adenine deaminase [Candidatus Arthromitus sp. SFB-rat-Yit]
MDKKIYIENIQASIKKIACDLVIKNITIVDVFQNSSFVSDVAIHNGYIVGLGDYSGKNEIDGSKKYICPGLIDAHAHIESSLLTPKEYYKTALIHGITSVIIDPHEIANVLGRDGINLMMDLSRDIPFDFYFMLPSCVPATEFENSGAVLNSSDLYPFYKNDKVLGLAEVMDLKAVLECDKNMIDKIYDAYINDKVIDGHCAGFSIDHINAYTTAYIKTDHECHTHKELIERIRRGMYVHIRERTVAKNLKELIQGVSIHNSRKLCLCTDDKHIDDFVKDGSIDNSIKMCIKSGLSPETSIQMATINTAECYKLNKKGAIAPGYIADFLILDSLHDFKISSVYKNGNLVVENNKLVNKDISNIKISLKTQINIPNLTEDHFKISIKNKSLLNVIEIIPNNLNTNHLKLNISSLNLNHSEYFNACTKNDLLKIGVIERHNNTGNIGLGIVKGLMLKSGAIATTIAHDSHNLIVCGTNDKDMILACNHIKKIAGGIVIIDKGEVLYSLSLEIGGLITNRKTQDVIKDLEILHSKINILSPNLTFNPFLTLSFLSLPVIPDIKITDKGLFDTINFKFINVCE